MQGLKISITEEERIENIIQAATSGSWDEFRRLSDSPFPNNESMREQFDDSYARIQRSGNLRERSSGIEIIGDGTRLIIIVIEAEPEVDIILSLISTDDTENSNIGIKTFLQQLDWSA